MVCVRAAMPASIVEPSNIQRSGGPTGGIWWK
jgi:hypothetical protein